MQQPPPRQLLGFARITADDAQQQRQRIACQFATELALHPPAPTQPKRPVGRPKRERDAATVLAAGAAAGASSASVAASAAAAAAATVTPLDGPVSKRGKYTNWFASPFLPDILAAYSRCHSARTAVTTLRRAHPDGRFARLSHATVSHWFDDQHRLLPTYQKQLQQHTAASRGRGPASFFTQAPDAEKEIKRVLLQMRAAGAPLNCRVIRWVMLAVLQQSSPALLLQYKLSQQFLSAWARQQLDWRWRARTTAASKLPADWESQGVLMAKRIAATMEMHNVHPSLVINADQTGVKLVPSSSWTYEKRNSSSVATIGADDKRQITACLASALSGDLLPLQLIFQGKTERSLPEKTAASIASHCHVTSSENHWSSQATMRQYISEIIMPHAEASIRKHRLHADAHIILVLDVWSVHKSEEFRMFLRTQHPRIHLVFVPANCTSKLQVADVSLQRPFKHSITRSFNEWAVRQIRQQIQAGSAVGLAELLRMATIKPLALQWCVDSWGALKERRDLITDAWHKCCVSLFNVMDPAKRIEAVAAVARQELEHTHVPAEIEEQHDSSESDSDDAGGDGDTEDDDELDVSQPKEFGSRKSQRQRTQATAFGYQLDSSAIALTEDSEH
jgi:DDE superfamily endonuclease